MSSYQEKRKKFLINPPFQIRFISYLLVISIIGISVLYFVNYIFFYNLEKEAFSLGLSTHHPYLNFIKEQRKDLNIIFTILSIHIVVLLFLAGLYLSHKVVGPLEKMRNHLECYLRGEKLSPLRFRKGDFFQEWPTIINHVINKDRH